jgi:hypothetical protein
MEVSWEDIDEPGAYVEKGTDDVYHIPREALVRGASPIIIKESRGASRLVQISKNPFVIDLVARHRCAQCNIDPNFSGSSAGRRGRGTLRGRPHLGAAPALFAAIRTKERRKLAERSSLPHGPLCAHIRMVRRGPACYARSRR